MARTFALPKNGRLVIPSESEGKPKDLWKLGSNSTSRFNRDNR